ncbi:MAG: hypothetical protein IPG18_08605 [Saprospiraceae bacterium]|nr:hypothetical protein [Saprospiraceae bacterium]
MEVVMEFPLQLLKFISTSGLQNEMLIPSKTCSLFARLTKVMPRLKFSPPLVRKILFLPLLSIMNLMEDPTGRVTSGNWPGDIIFKADDLLAGRELYIYKQKPLGAFFRIIDNIKCYGGPNGWVGIRTVWWPATIFLRVVKW